MCLATKDMPEMPERPEPGSVGAGCYSRRGANLAAQVAASTVLGVVLIGAATYALLMLGDAFLMGSTWGWTILSLAFTCAFGLAMPTVLVLWERVMERL